MRVSPAAYLALPLSAHSLLADVPLHDVSAVDLPGTEPGLTIPDLWRLMESRDPCEIHPLVRLLFRLRSLLGRWLGWDDPRHERPEASYQARLPAEVVRRSYVAPGTVNRGFRVLYVLDREAAQEIRNATVHAFLVFALADTAEGHRLYWGVYVQPVSRLTPIYMALIEPFRRFIVYPALLGQVRRAWAERSPPSPVAARPGEEE